MDLPWFNPSQQLSTIQPLTHSPLGRMGERIRRVKVWKFEGWDKDSLIGKAKAAHASKAKQGIHSLLLVGRQVFSQPQESRAPSRETVTWEEKRHHSECPPLPSSSPNFLLLRTMSHGMEYPFGLVGSVALVVSPPNSLGTPSSLTWQGRVRSRKCLGCL